VPGSGVRTCRRSGCVRRRPRGSAAGLAFAPDGKTLLVGFDDRIVFWDVEANEVKRKLTVNERPVILRLSEDGKTLTHSGGDAGSE